MMEAIELIGNTVKAKAAAAIPIELSEREKRIVEGLG